MRVAQIMGYRYDLNFLPCPPMSRAPVWTVWRSGPRKDRAMVLLSTTCGVQPKMSKSTIARMARVHRGRLFEEAIVEGVSGTTTGWEVFIATCLVPAQRKPCQEAKLQP